MRISNELCDNCFHMALIHSKLKKESKGSEVTIYNFHGRIQMVAAMYITIEIKVREVKYRTIRTLKG